MSVLNSTALQFVTGEDNQLITAAFGAAALLVATVVYCSFGSKDKENGFPKLPGLQLYHAWNFFRRRHEFLDLNFKRNLGHSFSFDVGPHKVTALNGEEGRRVFYTEAGLDPREGLKILGRTVRVTPTW